MRKLKLQMHISLDGYIAGTNGEQDWIVKGTDERLWQIVNKLPDSADTLLPGKKTAEDFVPHFEGMTPDNDKFSFARKMVNIPKIIFT